MAGTGKLFVFKTDVFWSQIKTAGWVIPYFFKCDHGSTTLPIQYLTLLTITVLPLTTVSEVHCTLNVLHNITITYNCKNTLLWLQYKVVL